MSSLPLPIAAFLAGLISFLSPCVLPLVPGYVSLISGAGLDELQTSQGQLKRRVMVNSLAFILGFSLVFIALGAVATEIGQALGQYKAVLSREAGVLIILFGLHMTGLVTIKALYSDVRLHNVKGNSTVWGSFAVGFAFAFGWTPCVGPILSVILGFASAEGSALKGVLLLAVYSLGLAMPFLLTSLGIGEFLKFYSRFKRYMHAVEIFSGVVLIGLGELLVFDRFTLISSSLAFLGRFEVWLEGAVLHNLPVSITLIVMVLIALYFAFRPSRQTISANTATPSVPAPTSNISQRAEQPSGDAVATQTVVVPARRNRNPLALVVVAVVAAAMLYFGVHMSRGEGNEAPPILGKTTPAPDFTLESLDGQSVTLSGLRGKAVLLNFWATWCGPCKIETPWLVELQDQYANQGLQVVGVAMDDSGKDEIAKFAKDMGMNYPVLLGKEAVGDEYGGVPALPESFFIGRDGKIVDRIIGLQGRSEIEDAIKKALKTSAAANQNAPSNALQAQN
ncbi:MAG TPA: cytochrome c biogenesis protein CcdA [Candidatus Sulfotelmatobacter sp.]|jgi:cytochrome c-type biogenesis protein|nr:cytochrome c biogenesis protein CcdA [Candidatus Sulfotelmatobacter sp.]